MVRAKERGTAWADRSPLLENHERWAATRFSVPMALGPGVPDPPPVHHEVPMQPNSRHRRGMVLRYAHLARSKDGQSTLMTGNCLKDVRSLAIPSIHG